MNRTDRTATHADTQRGTSLYVPALDRFVDRSEATARALERIVRSRFAATTVVTAAVVLAHLRGDETPNDAAMTLVDALIDGVAHRPTVIAAVRALGSERAQPLIRRALRMRHDEESVRDLASEMIALAFEGRAPSHDALTLEQHLALSTIAQHPTLWSYDTSWLAELHVGSTREAVSAYVETSA